MENFFNTNYSVFSFNMKTELYKANKEKLLTLNSKVFFSSVVVVRKKIRCAMWRIIELSIACYIVGKKVKKKTDE